MKIRRVDSCQQQQNTSRGKHQLQNLEDKEHVHIRTPKQSHMRPLMFPGDPEKRGGDGETHGKCSTFSEAREYGGTPLSYFPEIIPQARGDHVIAPTPEKTGQTPLKRCMWSVFLWLEQQQLHSPILWKSSGSCTSTFSLWNM